MDPSLEYDEAMRLYRKKLAEAAGHFFRLTPPTASAALSHRQAETWYLRDGEGRLLARVSPAGVLLPR